jgi:hypothetical protein
LIVGLAGYATAGKDSAADALVERAGFVKIAFADSLRACAVALDPIVGHQVVEEEYEPGRFGPVVTPIRYTEAIDRHGYIEAKARYPELRRTLQRLGTEVGREIIGPDVWVDATFNLLGESGDVAIADMRFPNEAKAVKARGGIAVRVDRPGVGPANDHPSEMALDDWPFDARVGNGSTLEALGDEIMDVIDQHRRLTG